MDSITTQLTGDPKQALHPADKELLRESKQEVVKDLRKLLNLLSSSQDARIKDKSRLYTAVRLAQNLGFPGTIDEDLQRLLWFSNKPLLQSHRTSIRPFIDYLLGLLDKSGSRADVPVSQNVESQLANMSIGSSTVLPLSKTLEQKLAASEFDKVLDREGGLNSETHTILRQAGMWRATPNYHTQKVKVLGNLSLDEFTKVVAGRLPPSVIDYICEKHVLVDEKRDDGCSHAGCRVVEGDDILEDYRFGLHKDVKEALGRHPAPSRGGSIGMFLKRSNHRGHYLVTAAHVLFPELSLMPLDSDDMKTFNQMVPFALYDLKHDIAMVKCGRNCAHDNGFRIAPSKDWSTRVGVWEKMSRWSRKGLKLDLLLVICAR
jgi:hypothetical protein